MLRTFAQLLLLIIIVGVLYLFIRNLSPTSTFNLNLSGFLSSFNFSDLGFGNLSVPHNLSYPTPTPPQNYVPQNETIAYALSLINQDRMAYGLPNVTYSNETSGQQHSESMLQYDYFAHWDPFGLKPYMRYTLVNGTQGVDENVAYIYNSSGINVLNAVKSMENSMMNNDQICCNNGHKYNILDPHHNQVSIGVAYNRTTVYFTEDFIDNYISWQSGTPNYNNGAVNLQGASLPGYSLSSVEVSYDPMIMNMTKAQLKNTSSYSYGQSVAGIGHRVGNSYYYFQDLQTVNATTYVTQNNNFDVQFNMNQLLSEYGPGEYSIMIFLTNNTSATPDTCYTNSAGIKFCDTFLAASYTIFINSTDQKYIPQNI